MPRLALCVHFFLGLTDTVIYDHVNKTVSSESRVPLWCTFCLIFARDSICYSAYAIARPSVRPSVTRVDHSKTVEARIMQLSPQGIPNPHDSSFLMVNLATKFEREPRERARQMREG